MGNINTNLLEISKASGVPLEHLEWAKGLFVPPADLITLENAENILFNTPENFDLHALRIVEKWLSLTSNFEQAYRALLSTGDHWPAGALAMMKCLELGSKEQIFKLARDSSVRTEVQYLAIKKVLALY